MYGGRKHAARSRGSSDAQIHGTPKSDFVKEGASLIVPFKMNKTVKGWITKVTGKTAFLKQVETFAHEP